MNPYLEHPDGWSTVHNRLIVAIADALAPQLLPKYQVDIEKRVYSVVGFNSLLVGRPDVSVQRPRQTDNTAQVVMADIPNKTIQVSVPVTEEVREAYLEIKEAATQIVVTAIEILSPTNKRGDGRQKYEQKRQQLLNSATHLVEIDLLRDGSPLPTVGDQAQSDYRLLVSRSDTRPLADLYPFNLPEPIPGFLIPLQAEDQEPVLKLQALLTDIYERAGYDYFIDYHTDPLPPLSAEAKDWINRVLVDHQRR